MTEDKYARALGQEVRSPRASNAADSLPNLSDAGVLVNVLRWLQEVRPDTDPAMKVWAAIALAGAVIGADVYVSPWRRRMGLNLYLLIVAPSGAGKGDLAASVEEAYVRVRPTGLLPDRFSSAGLGDALRETPAGLMVIDEGDELLKRSRMDAFADVIAMLCRSYDGRMTRERLRSRDIAAGDTQAVAPTMVVGIQPSALTQGVIEHSTMLSGLLGRCVVVAAQRPTQRVGINEAADDDNVPTDVVAALGALRKLQGRMYLSPEAQTLLAKWKRGVEADEPPDELGGAWARVPALAVKVAGIIAVARQASRRVTGAPLPVDGESMRLGMALASWAWAETQRVFGQDVAYTRSAAKTQTVMRYLRRMGGEAKQGKILEATGMSARELKEIRDTLEQRGDVAVTTLRGTGRPAFLWQLQPEAQE